MLTYFVVAVFDELFAEVRELTSSRPSSRAARLHIKAVRSLQVPDLLVSYSSKRHPFSEASRAIRATGTLRQAKNG